MFFIRLKKTDQWIHKPKHGLLQCSFCMTFSRDVTGDKVFLSRNHYAACHVLIDWFNWVNINAQKKSITVFCI